MGYIRSVYGSPSGAYSAWLSRSPHWYGMGGVIREPVIGVGRSGRLYGFAENGPETITPGIGGSGQGQRAIIGRLDRIIAAVERSPSRTGRATAEALKQGGKRGAYAGAYGN